MAASLAQALPEGKQGLMKGPSTSLLNHFSPVMQRAADQLHVLSAAQCPSRE